MRRPRLPSTGGSGKQGHTGTQDMSRRRGGSRPTRSGPVPPSFCSGTRRSSCMPTWCTTMLAPPGQAFRDRAYHFRRGCPATCHLCTTFQEGCPRLGRVDGCWPSSLTRQSGGWTVRVLLMVMVMTRRWWRRQHQFDLLKTLLNLHQHPSRRCPHRQGCTAQRGRLSLVVDLERTGDEMVGRKRWRSQILGRRFKGAGVLRQL